MTDFNERYAELIAELAQEVSNWDAQRDINYANSYIDSYKFLGIGIAIGILGNLWASLLHWLLIPYWRFYVPALAIASVLSVVFLFDLLIKGVDKRMSANPLLRRAWNKSKDEKNQSTRSAKEAPTGQG